MFVIIKKKKMVGSDAENCLDKKNSALQMSREPKTAESQ